MLHKLLRILYTGLVVGCSFAVCIVLHPIYYIIWAVYNRKSVALWLILSIVLISTLLPIQYCYFFSGDGHVMIWNPASNPFIIYGLCLTLLFVPTRMIALRQFSTFRRRYWMAIAIFIFQLFWLLIPVVPMHLIMSARFSTTQFVFMETTILLWDLLVSWLYIKYPDDIITRKMYRFIFNAQKTITRQEC